MFEIHFLVFLDLINIYTDTKTIKIEAFIANLQAHPVFRAAILNFEFLAGKPRATIWFPLFFNSAYSKNPRYKLSCFYPEVHDMAEKCHISAPLKDNPCLHFPHHFYKSIKSLFKMSFKVSSDKPFTFFYYDPCCYLLRQF